MVRTLKSSLGFGFLIALFLTACATAPAAQTETTASTAQIKSAWKNSTHEGHPRKVMVIGVAKDMASRKVFEDEFVRQLKARDTDAIASYTMLPDAKLNDTVVIAEIINEQGADAVLVTRLVSKKDAQIFVPGTIFHPQIYYDTWVDYFGYSYQALFMKDSIADDEQALLETNIYDALNKNMIWSSTSETEMLGSDQIKIKGTIGAMVNSMAAQKLLGK